MGTLFLERLWPCYSVTADKAAHRNHPPTIPAMARLLIALLIPAAIIAGCSQSENARPGEDASAEGARSSGAGSPAVDSAGTPVCLEGETYVADGPIPLSPPSGGDARGIASLRLGRHDGCERLVIDLAGDDGGDASVPGVVTADVLRDLGVVRIRLREVEAVDTAATEARFGGDLVGAAYTVRSPEGPWVFVDVHLATAAEASVMVLDEPARVVLDLRPGGSPVSPPAATHRRVVVLEPREGEASYPLTVTGYARTFEANVVARLERGGEDVFETFTTSTGYVDAWGYFSMTVPDGPQGPVTLHVGEYSARDGTWEGASVELEMR